MPSLEFSTGAGDTVPLGASHVPCPPLTVTPVSTVADAHSTPLPATSSSEALTGPVDTPLGASHTETAGIDWDYWPDGAFTRTFTHEEFQATNELMVHWSFETSGGSRGSEYAPSPEKGKHSYRRCHGHIKCDNPECQIIIRPKTRLTYRINQLSRPCACGGTLALYPCPASWRITRWAHGVNFRHTVSHNHPRLTHQLHLTAAEMQQFEELVITHPTAKPLELAVGVRGITGPGKSAADIAGPLLNKDRIKAERNRIRKGLIGGQGANDITLSEISDLCADNGFIKRCVVGKVVVICMQTATMISELVKDRIIEDEAVNGIVSDAAHGFWLDRSNLLIVSSAYSPTLQCWVPALMSFSNGASAEHYRIHFLTLFESIRDETKRRKIELIDELLAMVCQSSSSKLDAPTN